MMRSFAYFLRLAFFALVMTVAAAVNAQYYNDGQDPFSLKWEQVNTSRYRVIFPRQYQWQGQQVAAIIDTVTPYINFGFSMPARKVPVVLHAESLSSNGLVVWAPKRTELVTTPQTSNYATPWLKQLTVHEYRHVVQMSNLYRSTLKALTCVGGQQAIAIGAAQMGQWFLEGDAVVAETAFSPYGRGLQPEFTIEYRAYLQNDDIRQFPVDKWFAGSFKDYIPNHYNLGYQIVNHAYNMYGPGFWEDVTNYVARNPYFIIPKHFAFKKHYNTSSAELLYGAFDELKAKWDSLPRQANSATVFDTPVSSYTLYSSPVYIGDTTIVALKSDLDRPLRFVSVDTRNGKETHLKYVGQISSRPIYHNGELIWTEYKPSLFWERKNRSIVRRMDISSFPEFSVVKPLRGGKNLLYVTKFRRGFAAVEYDMGHYSINVFDEDFNQEGKFELDRSFSVHGLAWDRSADVLAAILLNDTGMFIAEADVEGELLRVLKLPSNVSINHLSAGGGKLLFNSISSGRDETHILELNKKGRQGEYRVTTSTFGSKMPAISQDGSKIAQVTYTRDGYMLSQQQIRYDSLIKEGYKRLPDNILNMPVSMEEGVVKLDTVDLSPAFDEPRMPVKKYRRLAHLFDLHSWAPASFDPFEAGNDRNVELDFGATIMSQNSLSTTTGYLTYGRVEGENFLKGKLEYRGFAPKIEVGFEYGGGKQSIISNYLVLFGPERKPYFSGYATVSLPLNFSGGYYSRYLTPAVKLTHVNALVFDADKFDFNKGYQLMEASLSYSQNTRMAYRDLAPRWGFSTRVSVSTTPFSSRFGTVYSASAGVYTPGVMKHHSLRLRGAVQSQDKNEYNFSSNVLFPRGLAYNFAPGKLAVALGDYMLPVAYPDRGIPGVLYIKRIYANLFGGFSRIQAAHNSRYYNVHSYGVDVHFNTNPFRLVDGSVDFRASAYKTSVNDEFNFSFGISIDI